MNDYSYLWNSQNPEWLRKRKADWTYIKKNNVPDFSAKDLKKHSLYFVHGERDSYINWVSLYIMTPFSTPDEANKVFYSRMFEGKERADIFKFFLDSASEMLNGLPWVRSHCLNFINGVMGNKYEPIEEVISEDENILIPDEPTSFVRHFFRDFKRVLNGSFRVDYLAYEDCFDYLYSCMKIADDKETRDRVNLEEVYKVANIVVDYDGPEVTSYGKQIASELIKRKAEIMELWEINE